MIWCAYMLAWLSQVVGGVDIDPAAIASFIANLEDSDYFHGSVSGKRPHVSKV